MILDKLLDLFSKRFRFDSRHDSIWWGLFSLYMFTVVWLMIGIYFYDWNLFKIIFWPINL